jgi:hypothetical protein
MAAAQKKSLLAELKAVYAEQWGFMCRQADDGRETNPYARLDLKVPSNIAKMKPLAEAWWRGWDRADAMLRNRAE